MVTISSPSPIPAISRQRLRPKAVGLAGHHDVGGRVGQERPREDRPAPEPVGQPAAQQRADEQAGEQRGDEARDAAGAEQPGRGRREDPGLDEPRGDVAGEQQVVEFEEEAEAEQRHEAPDRAGRRQPVEAGQDGAGIEDGSLRFRDPCRRHPPTSLHARSSRLSVGHCRGTATPARARWRTVAAISSESVRGRTIRLAMKVACTVPSDEGSGVPRRSRTEPFRRMVRRSGCSGGCQARRRSGAAGTG